MMRHVYRSWIAIVGILAVPVAWACSACLKDIQSPEEFDRRVWEQAAHVFVGLVLKAELQYQANTESEVIYEVRPEEVFKGDPAAVKRVFSQRHIDSWDSELKTISCGYISVAPGDRLLVVAGPDGRAALGHCSGSRVIEGAEAPADHEVKATLNRFRRWAGIGR